MITFYPITLTDVPHLLSVENACHSHPWTEKTFSSCIGGRYFGDYIKNSSENKNESVGFYVADHVAGEVTLMDICVHPDQQGKGLGKSLLLQCLANAKKMEADTVWLEVRAKNISAQMLYINHGFVETGRRTGYYPSAKGFGYEDAIIMKYTT